MKEDNFCPYCDKFIILDIIDDYYLHNAGDEVERIECPECNKTIVISWEISHRINFNSI